MAFLAFDRCSDTGFERVSLREGRHRSYGLERSAGMTRLGLRTAERLVDDTLVLPHDHLFDDVLQLAHITGPIESLQEITYRLYQSMIATR